MITLLILILMIGFMECLLSVDNALVLAIKVLPLPLHEQKKALFYGLWGAYIFRILAIIFGNLIIDLSFKFYGVDIPIVQVLGASYLAWIVIKHFAFKDDNNNETPDFMEKGRLSKITNKLSLFWRTIIAIELLDISFSADSIIAAFGISKIWWVIVVGGCIGILAMRGVANVFLALLKKFPEMEQTAFVLIGIIAAKMFASIFGFELNEFAFFGIIVVVFSSTFIVSAINKKKQIA